MNCPSELSWLASDIYFKLLHTGCPIAHSAEGDRRKALKVTLHLSWLAAEKFQNKETVKGDCIAKNKFKHKKH